MKSEKTTGQQVLATRQFDTWTVVCDCRLCAGSWSGLLFCKERLAGQVCGSAMVAWHQWTAAEATVRDTSTQKVERHVGDSSTRPTLKTEIVKWRWEGRRWWFQTVQLLPIWQMGNNYNDKMTQKKCSIKSRTNHSEQRSMLEVWMELHQPWFCTSLPLNKSAEKENKCYDIPLKFLQNVKYKPWQKLKNGSASRLKHGDDCGPISGERIPWGSRKDDWLKPGKKCDCVHLGGKEVRKTFKKHSKSLSCWVPG